MNIPAVVTLPARTLRVVLGMIARPARAPRRGIPVAVPIAHGIGDHGLVLFLETPK